MCQGLESKVYETLYMVVVVETQVSEVNSPPFRRTFKLEFNGVLVLGSEGKKTMEVN